MISEGIHDAIPMADYLADPCETPSLSSGIAHTLLTQSPLHAWQQHPRLGGEQNEESNVANIGTVVHDWLLGGEDKIKILDFPDWRTNASKEARAAARAAGNTPILEHQADAARSMVASALTFVADSPIAGIFDNGKPEQTIIWNEAGVWLRARPDWLTNDGRILLHVKTTEGAAEPGRFIRTTFANMGYGFVMAFYARGLARMGAPTQARHLILVIEQNAPYACSLVALTPSKAAIEAQRVEAAIKGWRECVTAGRWPGYDNRIHYAEPTAWEIADSERMATDNTP